ncbi:CAMK protein kinase [Kwoniella heveanensis CBS 569]|nr:CAMK protein kinase [Kwoniella heveanensis CBS 569]
MPTSKSSIDNRDVYYRLGKSAGYRARSAYKLLHLDEEFDLFNDVQTAVDLCAAPGSWSQVLGQKLHPSREAGGKRVVSLDLQPMAPLPNITTLQTDITLPSTIPLVLDALDGRKADLVVCDGAPDVTGVHDLDAYLHSQLLLAAITLSLTLLAPHGTLIFKIFLSPLDPQAALLASQLRCFFPSPPATASEAVSFQEFDLLEDAAAVGDSRAVTGASISGSIERQKANIGKEGYDALGRRGGVWVRKPRSSRKGSGEAFIVCRNFEPSRVPLPSTFSHTALTEMRNQTTGTLTLDSLASLGVGSKETSKEWEMIKGYVGGGDLNERVVTVTNSRQTHFSSSPIGAVPTPAKTRPSTTIAPPISVQMPEPSASNCDHLSTSPKALFAQPTPLDGPPEYFQPKPDSTHRPEPTSPTRQKSLGPPTFLSPERLHIDANRSSSSAKRERVRGSAVPDLGEGRADSRQASLDSLTPNPSPISLLDPTRPWDPSSHIPPPTYHGHSHSVSASGSGSLNVPSGSRFRSGSNASVSSMTSAHREDEITSTTPLVSPALSSSSKTDLFFTSSAKDTLPIPPRALPHSSTLGRGLPDSLNKSDERATSMPLRRDMAERTSAWAEGHIASGSGTGSIDLTSPSTSNQGYSAYSGLPNGPTNDLRFGFEEITTTSRLRSVSNPAPPSVTGSPSTTNYSPATSRFLKSSNLAEPLATLPTLPNVDDYASSPTRTRPTIKTHGRRESQQLEREHREARQGVEVKSGDVIRSESETGSAAKYDCVTSRRGETGQKQGWKLIRKLGEGAFSSVWSATPVGDDQSGNPEHSTSTSSVAALKMMDRQLSLRDSRTRISFLREVEVLRHISHPSIVSYLDSFTTPTHHVLILEELGGGELFDLMSDDENRRRMILPAPRPDPELASEGANGWDRDGEGFVRRIFGELTRAVGWLHEVGVVHRDIKLENILFTVNPFTLPPTSTGSIPLDQLPHPGPLVKLTDFGLSRFISISTPLLQTRCGSESFAAPEIIMGKPYDGRQTDAWAMGVVLYGLIVGELPFDREEDVFGPSSMTSSVNPSGVNTPYSSSAATPSGGVGSGAASRPYTPSLETPNRNKGRKRMLRIAKGEYSFPEGMGSENVRSLIKRLLVRDPAKRIKVSEIWYEEFMASSSPGAVERPKPTPSPQQSPRASVSMTLEGSDAAEGEGQGGRKEVRKRRVLDGFLVEEDGIEEVARAEL